MIIVLSPQDRAIIDNFLIQLGKGLSTNQDVTITTNSVTPVSPTPTPTISNSATPAPSTTPTGQPSPSQTPTPAVSQSATPAPSVTPTPTISNSPSPSAVISPTPSNTPSPSTSLSNTRTRTPTPTPAASQTATPAPSQTRTPAASQTPTPAASQTRTPAAPTPSNTPTRSQTRTPAPTPSVTPSSGTPLNPLLDVDLSYVDTMGRPFTRFKSFVDAAVGGNFGYGFSAMDAAYMYKITGGSQYATLAIRLAEEQVADAEAAMAQNQNPDIAGDSYLDVGGMMTDVGLVFVWCSSLLTPAQKQRWKAYGDQAIFNVWNYQQASWAGRSAPWSGWSVNDPGNNYYYSFLTATIIWACATNSPSWLSYLANDRIPLAVNYFQPFVGGGTREGTGYGLAVSSLFQALTYWHDSGQGTPPNILTWIKDTMNYWVHATVPTLNKTAAIGDQSRVSEPVMYDYQRALILKGRRFVTDQDVLDDTSWWLHNISVNEMSSGFNFKYDLLPAGAGGTPPATNTYYASAAGVLFTRTDWTPTAMWLDITVGKFDQSHAHQEQGGFTLYKNNWLAVTENIWSHSGIQQGTETNNVLRFVKNGSIIGQQQVTTSTFNITSTGPNGEVHATANLKPAYGSQSAIGAWNRTYDFVNSVLTITDTYATDAQTTTYFQLQTPSQPVVSGNVITAGHLKVTVVTPTAPTINIVDWRTQNSDYLSGWRIDISGASGTFVVKLEYV